MILFIGLTGLQVFTKSDPLYMRRSRSPHTASTGSRRLEPVRGNNRDQRRHVRGVHGHLGDGRDVFLKVGDWPVGLLFLGLFGVYFCDFFG